MVLLHGCNIKKDEEYSFSNGNFETGDLTGWETSGDVFSDLSVSKLTVSDDKNIFDREGKFFLYGKVNGGEKTGSITSETFKLKGNGKIGLLIGGGSNTEKCYVALIDGKGNELVKKANDDYGATGYYDRMYRVVLDGSKYVGKKVRIKVVDNDSSDNIHNYINVDDFIINYKGKEEKPGATLAADKYIEKNMDLIEMRYRHTYHVMPPVGWMNDPNGLIYAFDKYNVFYQFHPYSSAWGPMHWGHYTSKDLIKWELQPTAIAPDTEYDKDGCFSGTAIMKDNRLYLMYTSVSNGVQTQALARSTDGINFTKAGKVIGSELLPIDASRADFRDPSVFYRDGMYYAIMGSYNTDGSGQLLMYKSEDLYNWSFVGTVWKDKRTRGIYECPNLFSLGGKDVLITSPQGFATDGYRHENLHSNLYMIGNLDLSTGAFSREVEDEIDSGFDFYAPQTLTAPDGRTILIAWMQMWDRYLPTQKDGWVGATTLPRELSIVNGKLYQSPVREIENYRKNKVVKENQDINGEVSFEEVKGNTVEIKVTFDLGNAEKIGVKVYKGEVNETKIYYDRTSNLVVFDRSNMGTIISHASKEKDAKIRSTRVEIVNNKLEMRIFLDVSSCEVFLNGGERTLTGNVYSWESDTGISFFTEGGSGKIVSLEKYDIVV